MLATNVRLLLKLYRHPLAAMSGILDEGSWGFSAAAVLAVSLLLHIPGAFRTAGAAQGRHPHLLDPVYEFIEFHPSGTFAPLIVLAAVVVPVSILILVIWDSLGGLATILRRDYAPVFACAGMAWTAAYLPLAAGSLAAPAVFAATPWIWAAGALGCIGLLACGLRTVTGTGFAKAGATAAAASTIAVGALAASSVFGVALSALASPFLLFYLVYFFWGRLSGDVHALGSGLRTRQSYRRHLEAATLNPRDSDAHYQLGLILQQRRQYGEAISRFKRAIEIDPGEADALYQLGRIAAEQKRLAEALEYFQQAAQLDDRHNSSEVWREIGAAQLAAGRPAEARPALEKYVERRPYDPEGLYWLGKALGALGEQGAARESFTRCVEAAKTAPSYRGNAVRRWGRMAAGELKNGK